MLSLSGCIAAKPAATEGTRQKTVANQHNNPKTRYHGIRAANLHVSKYFSLVTALLSVTVTVPAGFSLLLHCHCNEEAAGYFWCGSSTRPKWGETSCKQKLRF